MSDLISRSAVIEALDQHSYENGSDYEKTVELLNEIPAVDAVPVVRCKDCKRWKPCAGATEHVKCCEWAGYMIGENGYCVYGEVKNHD